MMTKAAAAAVVAVVDAAAKSPFPSLSALGTA